MRHKWERHSASETIYLPFVRARTCLNCGAAQTYETEHSWGRVVSRYWYPKVGRCTKDKPLEIRGKLGTHSTAIFKVKDIDEPPSLGDTIIVRSDGDLRVLTWTEVMIDQIKFGDFYYLSFR